MKLAIELPWPSADLSQNARHGSHWPRTRAIKLAREDARWLTRQAMGAQLGPQVVKIAHDGASDIILEQVAHPPDRRGRDRDGLDSRLKAARDGIADALQVNDRFFRPTGIQWGEPTRGGKVVVTVNLPEVR